jgi:hypothetical protein
MLHGHTKRSNSLQRTVRHGLTVRATTKGRYGDSVVVLDPPQTEMGHNDIGERRQEGRFWVEQERLADEEKADRAREILELMRQKEIEQQRMTAGLCVFCGQRLRIVLRWFRVKKHRGCHSFTE